MKFKTAHFKVGECIRIHYNKNRATIIEARLIKKHYWYQLSTREKPLREDQLIDLINPQQRLNF